MISRLKAFALTLAILIIAALATAQDGVSTAGLARTKYLGSASILPESREVTVEDFVNYHRHEIARPKAGEAVALDVRWGTETVAPNGDAILQIGLSTALAHDKEELKPLNLAIVIDKSGSMADDNKLVRVKAALRKLVGQLRPTDTLSIVVFDSNAEVLLPSEPVTDPGEIDRVIDRVQPGSATNLNGGLMLGYQEAQKHFRKDANNRVMLLTDGIANRGVTDPEKIAEGSASYNDRGIDLCTVGVGSDVNQDFLRRLAKSGRGLFHFVANSEDIDQVFVKEFQSQISPVATEPDLTIKYGSGLELKKVYGYGPSVGDDAVRIKLDNMNSGMTEVVLLRFKADAETGTFPVKVKLSYYDLDRKKSVGVEEASTIRVGEGAKWDDSVEKNYTIAQLAQGIKDMAGACEKGQFREAQDLVNAPINYAQNRYPSQEDKDIKRTLDIAVKYRDALRERNGDSDKEVDRDVPQVRATPLRTLREEGANILSNGDFAQGNKGFLSGLPYAAPGVNCLWPAGYTVAPGFNNPVLHTLVMPGDYAAPDNGNGNSQVLFANAGGADALVLWSTVAQVKPNRKYRITFQAISLSGSDWANGHEIPTDDWDPDFQITVNGKQGAGWKAGKGHYSEVSMVWSSESSLNAVVSIVRMPIAHGGGVVGVADIKMVAID